MQCKKQVTGELENLPKPKTIFQYCGNDLISSCKVFLFIMSDLKLVQIAFIGAASHLPPVLPPLVSFCKISKKKKSGKKENEIMLLLHLPLSFSFYSNPGPRTTRPSCHFLGLYEIASSFSNRKKTSAHLGFVAFTDPHITYPDMKTKGTTTSKRCHQHILCATPADEVRQLQDVRARRSGRAFAHSHLYRRRNIINT